MKRHDAQVQKWHSKRDCASTMILEGGCAQITRLPVCLQNLFFKRRVSYWERVLMPTWTACFGRRCRQHFLLIVFLQHVLIFTPYKSLSCSPLISCEALILRPRVCWWNEWVTLSFVHICSYVLKEQCTTSVIWILHVCYIPRCFIVLGQYYKWNFPPNIPFYFQLVTVGFVDM